MVDFYIFYPPVLGGHKIDAYHFISAPTPEEAVKEFKRRLKISHPEHTEEIERTDWREKED